MTTPSPLHLDVRPLCERKLPPLPAILNAVGQLAPGQGLTLVAPFEPAPLYDLLRQRGFSHQACEQPDGSWEIRFEPTP